MFFAIFRQPARLLLNNNTLSGSIPQDVGNLSKLILLDLSNNRFEGAIFSIVKRIQRSPVIGFSPGFTRPRGE